MRLLKWGGAIVALSLTVVALGVWAFAAPSVSNAEEPVPGTVRTGVRANYLENLAEKLGVSVEQLRGMQQDAFHQLVTDALANGRITPEQAERLSNLTPGEIKAHRGDRMERVKSGVRHVMGSVAGIIGVSPEELRTALRGGQSLAQVAADNGVSRDELKSEMVAALETRLDAAVVEGKITLQQAEQIEARLTSNLDKVIDKQWKMPTTSQ